MIKPRSTAFMKKSIELYTWQAYKYNHTNMLYVYFLVEKWLLIRSYIPFNRTIIIKQVGMNRAMIGIDLQKVEELVLYIIRRLSFGVRGHEIMGLLQKVGFLATPIYSPHFSLKWGEREQVSPFPNKTSFL